MHKIDGKKHESSGYTNEPRFASVTTPEMYEPMEVPEHIYVTGVQRKPANKEVRPQMVVPGRITVGGGDTTVGSQAQPTEVLRDRLPTSDDQGINISGIPDMLTANELPHEDFTQRQIELAQSPDNPHYSSQTSIVVDKDPLNEVKQMRRRLNQLAKRVQILELDSQSYKDERQYLFAGIALAFVLLLAPMVFRSRR